MLNEVDIDFRIPGLPHSVVEQADNHCVRELAKKICDVKGNEEECVANSKVVSILAKKFGIGKWSFIGPGSEKKWYSMEENSPQGI